LPWRRDTFLDFQIFENIGQHANLNYGSTIEPNPGNFPQFPILVIMPFARPAGLENAHPFQLINQRRNAAFDREIRIRCHFHGNVRAIPGAIAIANSRRTGRANRFAARTASPPRVFSRRRNPRQIGTEFRVITSVFCAPFDFHACSDLLEPSSIPMNRSRPADPSNSNRYTNKNTKNYKGTQINTWAIPYKTTGYNL
jgi:hypothetical protein